MSEILAYRPRDLDVEFIEHHGGNERYKYAAEAADLAHGLLAQINAFGHWSLHLETKVRSRGSAKLKLKSESSHGICLIVKPGNNDSAIKCRLVPPSGLAPQAIFGRLLLAMRNNTTDHDDDDDAECVALPAPAPAPVPVAPPPAAPVITGPSNLLGEFTRLAQLKDKVTRWREGREILPELQAQRGPLLVRKAEIEQQSGDQILLLRDQATAKVQELEHQIATTRRDFEQQIAAAKTAGEDQLRLVQQEIDVIDREIVGYALPSDAEFHQAEQEWAAVSQILQQLKG